MPPHSVSPKNLPLMLFHFSSPFSKTFGINLPYPSDGNQEKYPDTIKVKNLTFTEE